MSYNILFADKTKMITEVMGFALDNENIQVHLSTTFENIMATLKKEKFDLLIIDEELGALEVADRLKKIELNKDTEIFVISYKTTLEQKKEARKKGITGWIEKPFIPENLVKSLKSYLHFKKKEYLKNVNLTTTNNQ